VVTKTPTNPKFVQINGTDGTIRHPVPGNAMTNALIVSSGTSATPRSRATNRTARSNRASITVLRGRARRHQGGSKSAGQQAGARINAVTLGDIPALTEKLMAPRSTQRGPGKITAKSQA